MKRVLLALWVGGAVIYAAGTITALVNPTPFDTTSNLRQAPTATTVIAPSKSDPSDTSPAKRRAQTESSSSDAVITRTESLEGPETIPAADTEFLRVLSPTSIRNSPSNSADVIGTAREGARVQVAERESGWVHFIDPNSGRSGWIDSVFLGPVVATADAEPISQADPSSKKASRSSSLDAPAPASPSRKSTEKLQPSKGSSAVHERPAKQSVSKRPRPAAKQVAKPQDEVVEFPVDEEFMPPRKRRFGLFARRRMMMQAPPPSLHQEWPPLRERRW